MVKLVKLWLDLMPVGPRVQFAQEPTSLYRDRTNSDALNKSPVAAQLDVVVTVFRFVKHGLC